MKIKGQNLRLLLVGAALPEETNVSITLTGNKEDTSTKDTEGMYATEDIVSKSWSAQADTNQAEPDQLKSIIAMFNSDGPFNVGFDQTKGSQNRTPANANFGRNGYAILNDFTMQFDDHATVNCSLQFQGTGGLSTL